MKIIEHVEGKTRLLVPKASLAEDPPPTSPVFFNPAASLNRDVTVAMTAAGRGATFCDSMAGIGARGVRVANEVGGVEKVTMVDFNPTALKIAARASVINGVSRKCEFSRSETSSYLFSRLGRDQRFDYVDVDPFGTPARQIQAALSATADGGILSVTATDTAVLCGVHPNTCRRRYGSSAVNNHFHHETGIRILLGTLARQGAPLDIGIEPLAEHSTRHYFRIFARVREGASKADSSLRNLGYIEWCPGCGETRGSPCPEASCAACGGKTRVAGPLWLGKMIEESCVVWAKKKATERKFAAAADLLDSLLGVDAFPPWSFSIERVCSVLRVPTPPESGIYRNLTRAGHKVMRTPFERAGIKSDARYREVVAAIRSAARSKRAPRA